MERRIVEPFTGARTPESGGRRRCSTGSSGRCRASRWRRRCRKPLLAVEEVVDRIFGLGQRDVKVGDPVLAPQLLAALPEQDAPDWVARATESQQRPIWGRSQTKLRWNFGSRMSPSESGERGRRSGRPLGCGSLGTGAVGPDVAAVAMSKRGALGIAVEHRPPAVSIQGYRRPRGKVRIRSSRLKRLGSLAHLRDRFHLSRRLDSMSALARQTSALVSAPERCVL